MAPLQYWQYWVLPKVNGTRKVSTFDGFTFNKNWIEKIFQDAYNVKIFTMNRHSMVIVFRYTLIDVSFFHVNDHVFAFLPILSQVFFPEKCIRNVIISFNIVPLSLQKSQFLWKYFLQGHKDRKSHELKKFKYLYM